MKRYITIAVTIAVLAGGVSCKKALTEKMHSAITPENFYKTEQDAEAALNGAFGPLQYQPYYQRGVYLVNELAGDIFYPNAPNADRMQIYTGTYTAPNAVLTIWWTDSYLLIKNANDVIAYVPGIEMDVTRRNNLVGNAYFLRAMAYYDLASEFGAVPLMIDGKNPILFPYRTSADSVFDQVIKDLLFAEANCLHMDALPASEVGRATSEAASAMLARVYLKKASMGGGADFYQKALDECNKLIAYSASHSSVLTLSPNYADIFDVNTKNGPESIFAVQFGDPPGNVNITNLMFDPESLGGFASFLPTDHFLHIYDVDDKRKAVNLGTVDAGVTYISKYRDPGVSAGSLGRNNWIVLRYADVLMMQSEAKNALNAGDATKFDGINAVRARAGLGARPLTMANTPSADDFVTALVDERLREFCVEGHRRNDLIRLKRFQQAKAAEGFTIDDNHLLMPIPQSERDVNQNLSQNLGY
ncbi:MAG TPA: RagB/SusD family nutrient uptake outer membrane protein [Puia sp.]|nr:RagB/SusD family nutrient uptake outer membrane protein [Puia sp.]